MHPRVVLPQSSTKKRLLNEDESNFEKTISPSKRLRYEDAQQMVNRNSYYSFIYDLSFSQIHHQNV